VKAVARSKGEHWAHDVEVDGHSLIVDEPPDEGGKNTGPSPTRLLTASLASCTAITVEMYAERKQWDLGGFEVEVEADTDAKPAHFEVALKVPGALDDDQVERLRVIAGKCPVHRILKAEAKVTDRVERV
jgi:putative redox protein